MIYLKCVKPMTSAVLAATVAATVFLWASNASADDERRFNDEGRFSDERGFNNERGFYVGGAYGMGRVNNSDFDDDNSAIKAFLGGKMNRYFGVEGAINDYGEGESRGFSSDLTGNSLALIGFLPVTDNVELYLKGGKLWWKNKVTVLDTFRDTLKGNDNFYGIGANFNFNQTMALKVEMERYKVEFDAGIGVDGSSDVDVASVGIVFNY